MNFHAGKIGLIALGIAVASTSSSAELDASAKYRKKIERSFIDFYKDEKRTGSVVEKVDFLKRHGFQQPIRVVYNKNIEPKNRVLVVAIDDGARNLFPDSVDTVVVGLPLSDRIRDLVPRVAEDAQQGTMEWSNARVTTPDSKQFLAFLENQLLPYVEKTYGPFAHRSLIGSSYGGLFTIETLLTEPQLFDSYIASSPSLWYSYSHYEALAIEAATRPERYRNRCLVLSAGEDEAAISSRVRNFERLIRGLQLPLITYHQRNAEIDHAHNRSIAFAYGWDKIFNTDDLLPPSSAISASTLQAFNQYLSKWLSETSCTSNLPIKSAPAYAAFAAKLAGEKNWSEMRLLHDFLVENIPMSSRSFGAVLHGFLWQFDSFPEEQKSFWAARYRDFLDQKPYSSGEIHDLNGTIIEYISNQ